MAKAKKTLVAGLVAGAAAFLSKKENRDKVLEVVNTVKEKAAPMINSAVDAAKNLKKDEQPTNREILSKRAQGAASKEPIVIAENEMLDEGGAQELIQEYNEKVDDGKIK